MNSTCSTGSKYDVYELRSEVGHCKARVQRLKRELAKMDAEVCSKQKGDILFYSWFYEFF